MSLNAEKREQALRDEIAELREALGNSIEICEIFIDKEYLECVEVIKLIDAHKQLLAKGGE